MTSFRTHAQWFHGVRRSLRLFSLIRDNTNEVFFDLRSELSVPFEKSSSSLRFAFDGEFPFFRNDANQLAPISYVDERGLVVLKQCQRRRVNANRTLSIAIRSGFAPRRATSARYPNSVLNHRHRSARRRFVDSIRFGVVADGTESQVAVQQNRAVGVNNAGVFVTGPAI